MTPVAIPQFISHHMTEDQARNHIGERWSKKDSPLETLASWNHHRIQSVAAVYVHMEPVHHAHNRLAGHVDDNARQSQECDSRLQARIEILERSVGALVTQVAHTTTRQDALTNRTLNLEDTRATMADIAGASHRSQLADNEIRRSVGALQGAMRSLQEAQTYVETRLAHWTTYAAQFGARWPAALHDGYNGVAQTLAAAFRVRMPQDAPLTWDVLLTTIAQELDGDAAIPSLRLVPPAAQQQILAAIRQAQPADRQAFLQGYLASILVAARLERDDVLEQANAAALGN